MTKAESKYFNTATKIDEAFLSLLERKDFEYVTVKEICQAANVNRSTFYLHYETLGDLLDEASTYLINKCNAKYPSDLKLNKEIIQSCGLDDLYLISSKFLIPYLTFIKDNKKLFETCLRQSKTLNLEKSYTRMYESILSPIMTRFGISEKEKPYVISFYIQGIIGLIKEWIKNDCSDDPAFIVSIIEKHIKTIK